MGNKREKAGEFEKVVDKMKEEIKEEITELKEKIDAQNKKIRAMGRRIEELEEKLLDKEEREAIKKEKELEYELQKMKIDNESAYKIKNKKDECKDELASGFVDKYVEQIWKTDTSVRRRMIIVAKGKRHEEARQDVQIWFTNIAGIENKHKWRAVRSMKDSVWYCCQTKEMRNAILDKRNEVKQQGWYKLDEVLTRKEREDRYRLYEFAKKWCAKEEEIKIVDNTLYIYEKAYKWNQEEDRVVKIDK